MDKTVYTACLKFLKMSKSAKKCLKMSENAKLGKNFLGNMSEMCETVKKC